MFLQDLFKVVGPLTSPSYSGCWCRWSCGCFLCPVRSELRLSSTALCQTKRPRTMGVTLLTADQLRFGLLRETLAWQKSCGRPARKWWNWPDGDQTHFICWQVLLFIYGHCYLNIAFLFFSCCLHVQFNRKLLEFSFFFCVKALLQYALSFCRN